MEEGGDRCGFWKEEVDAARSWRWMFFEILPNLILLRRIKFGRILIRNPKRKRILRTMVFSNREDAVCSFVRCAALLWG